MAVEIIFGAERSGKKTFLLKKAGEVIRPRGSDQLIFLVPTQVTLRNIPGMILEETSIPAIFKPQIHTFESLAEKIIREADIRFKKIDPIRSQYLLSEIINDHVEQGTLELFRESAPRKGFLNYIHSFINSMKQAEIPAEMILADLKGEKSGLAEAASIYKSYQDYLHSNNLYDDNGLFWKAKEVLAESIPDFLKRPDVLMIYGFTSFTYIQRNILEILRTVIPNIILSVCYEDDPQRKDLFNETFNIINSLKEPFLVKTPMPVSDNGWRFRELERRLFKAKTAANNIQPADLSSVRDGIKLFSAPDIHIEMEAISSKIKTLILKDGYAPDEIAVVCPVMKDYEKYIRRAFNSAGIPFVLPFSNPLNYIPIGNFFMNISRAAMGELPRKDFKGLAGSRFFYMYYKSLNGNTVPNGSVISFSECAASAVDLIESTSISRGISSWLEHFNTLISSNIPSVQGTVVRALIAFINIHRELRNAPDLATAGKVLKDLLNKISRQENVAGKDKWSKHDYERDAADALNGLFELTLPTIKKEPDKTSGDALRKLLFALERTNIETDATLEGKVLVTNPYAFRGRRTRALFFIGLNNGAFPQYQRMSGIPFRSEIIKLGNQYESRLPRRLDTAQDQMILFYSVLCSADDLITLSWVQNDENDKSIFIDDVMHSIEGLKIETEIPFCLKPEFSRITNPSKLFQAMQIALLNKKIPVSIGGAGPGGKNRTPEMDECEIVPAGFLQENMDRYSVLSSIENSREGIAAPDVYDGVLSSPKAIETIRKKYKADFNFSATMFKNFGHCPFRFFGTDLLKLKILEEKDDEFRPLDEGSAYHSILRSLYSALLRKKKETGIEIHEIEKKEILDLLDGLIEDYFREGGIARKVLITEYLEAGKAEMKKILRRFVSFDLDELGTFVPSMFEAGFGKLTEKEDIDSISSPEPVTIEYETEKINLAGKIDRVDIDDENGQGTILVLDYKTSSYPEKAELITGMDFQLQIYLLAAEDITLRAGLKPKTINALYCAIKKMKKGKKLERDGNEMTYSDTKETLKVFDMTKRYMFAYKNMINSGFFPPYVKNDCGYCGMRRLCRFNRTRIELKKMQESEDV
jgi:ATP-dependent helicase/nuclease subunit B